MDRKNTTLTKKSELKVIFLPEHDSIINQGGYEPLKWQ